jgi:hypothetical protein
MAMYIVDDPTLALIMRFGGAEPTSMLSEVDFLLKQVAAIEHYVDRFPQDERQVRALEWIEGHACQYRQQWQKQAAIGLLANARCADCPLARGSQTAPCPIHKKWLQLLHRYATNEISGQQYIEDTLKLLKNQKDRLRVTKIQCRSRLESLALTTDE